MHGLLRGVRGRCQGLEIDGYTFGLVILGHDIYREENFENVIDILTDL